MSTAASRDAYQEQLPQMTGKRAYLFTVYRDVKGNTGMTIREACAELHWPYNTTSARIHELAEAGLICPRGDTRDRQTVWVVTPADQVAFWREQRRKEREKRAVPAPLRRARFVYLPAAVRGDGPFRNTVAPAGIYRAHVNPEGAVSVTADDGHLLGVKPGEFVDAQVRWA